MVVKGLTLEINPSLPFSALKFETFFVQFVQ